MSAAGLEPGIPNDFEAWLVAVEGPEHELAQEAVGFVRGALDDAEETVKWNQPCWVIADSNCRYLSSQAGSINLGFFEGAALEDPPGCSRGRASACAT